MHPGRSPRPALAAATLAALAALATLAAPRQSEPKPPAPALPPGPAYTTPPAPVLPAAAALAAITLQPGLRAELVASEPSIRSPVFATFDEDGRLWVVEMPAFMRNPRGTDELSPTGRIVILDDRDGDGTFESSTVFLDGLVLPRSVAPCFGGALVIEPPAIYFCPDEDRDGRADSKQELITGMGGLDNPEHAGNSLLYGMDNWYHLSQHNIEFRFDGTSVQKRRTPDHGQWGLTQDDRGRLYYTPNSDPLLFDHFPKHYAARNRDQPSTAGIGTPIAGSAKPTFPSRPTPGVNRGYMDGILRKDGTLANLTAACGPSIYRADALGPGFRNSVFICEPAGLLVKRLTLSDRGGIPAASNAYQSAEFLTSTDERFRPVHSLVGPDGALYLIDFARGIIQHKVFLTPYLKDQAASRALEQPLDMGRIYRITSTDQPHTAPPRLSSAADEELVALLSHKDGWWRDTAQRLLVQRHATGIEPRLRGLLAPGTPEVTRLHILWTLEGLGRLTQEDALAAMRDPVPSIRAAGLRLSEPFLSTGALRARAAELIDDPARQVRIQAAASLGQCPDPADIAPLHAAIARHGDDRIVLSAAISSLSGREADMLKLLLNDPNWAGTGAAVPALNSLTDTAIRAGAGSCADLADLAADLALKGDGRAWLLISRIRQAQHLTAVTPRPLELARVPDAWLAAAADPDCLLAGALSESAVYFDWPGRPPVRRPKNLRPLTAAESALAARGEALYAICAACHMADGKGSPGQGAALAGSSRVEGPDTKLTRILLHGFEGEYSHSGSTFSGTMPPAPLTTDEELAAVMTYIRRAWGNTADPVAPETVRVIRNLTKNRTTPWTKQDLDPPGGF